MEQAKFLILIIATRTVWIAVAKSFGGDALDGPVAVPLRADERAHAR